MIVLIGLASVCKLTYGGGEMFEATDSSSLHVKLKRDRRKLLILFCVLKLLLAAEDDPDFLSMVGEAGAPIMPLATPVVTVSTCRFL